MHFIAGLRYAERAEAGLLRNLGILDDWGDYPRRAVEADYSTLPHFDEELDVRIRLAALGRTSITWAWEIWQGERLCVQGRHTVVHVDHADKPDQLPANVREKLEPLLGPLG
jgi:acyl-CoA thioester hydrolase